MLSAAAGITEPLVEVKHNCAVTMEHEIVPTTNGQNLCLTVDLRKAAGNPFILRFRTGCQ